MHFVALIKICLIQYCRGIRTLTKGVLIFFKDGGHAFDVDIFEGWLELNNLVIINKTKKDWRLTLVL